MTKKEYEELHRVVKDKLGHQLHVGDLVIGYSYSNDVDLYRIKRICAARVAVVKVSNTRWGYYRCPSRLIKIKEDGISED